MALLLFYLGLGTLLTLEEAGVFLLPGDISLIAAGIHGAKGGSFLPISWLVASLGMVLGASLLFRLLRRHRRTRGFLPERALRLIDQQGSRGVAIARLVPGLRNATVFAAAGSRLSYREVLCGLVPAAFLWSGFLLLAGWFGGEAALSLFRTMHASPLVNAISVGLVVAAAALILLRFRSLRRALGDSPSAVGD